MQTCGKDFPVTIRLHQWVNLRHLPFALVLGLLTNNMQVCTSMCASCRLYSFVQKLWNNLFFNRVRSSTMNRSFAKTWINNGLGLEVKMREISLYGKSCNLDILDLT